MDYLLYLMFRCDGKFGKFGGVWDLNTRMIYRTRLEHSEALIRVLLLLTWTTDSGLPTHASRPRATVKASCGRRVRSIVPCGLYQKLGSIFYQVLLSHRTEK